MSQLTLQINSLEALERLIGGDTQVEIDIRNSVVQKFADKHLKAVANSDAVRKTMEGIQAAVQKQIADRLEQGIATFKSTYGGSVYDVKLHPEIVTVIESKVRNTIDQSVQRAVQSAIDNWTGATQLEERIQKRVDYHTKEKIDQEIKSRLEKIKMSL